MKLPNIPAALKSRLLQAAAGGTIAIAGVLVSWHEGRAYSPYLDPAGVLTVCDGHTGPDIILGKTYTDVECDALRDADLKIAERAVDRSVKVPINKWQKAALIDFTFNLGAGRLASSTLLRKLNVGDYDGACEEYRKWTKARVRGILQVLKGLFNRREADRWVCYQH